MLICDLCPRNCRSERTPTSNENGFCQMPLLPKVARAALHFWEEPCISGTNGSGTVFFSGCSLRCIFCQNRVISADGSGKTVTPQRLSQIFKELEALGAHNINLVSPTHYALAIREALDIYKPDIPIVYNSGGYDKVSTLSLLDGYIDIFLMDLKYSSSERAAMYSKAADYPQVAKSAILEAARQQPEAVIKNGIMQKGIIVRHLLLPQGTKDAIAVFDWVKDNVPNAFFSIMSQYTPCGTAKEDKIIGRKVTAREYSKVVDHIAQSGFENCYIQERTSSDKAYIPPFDLTGV